MRVIKAGVWCHDMCWVVFERKRRRWWSLVYLHRLVVVKQPSPEQIIPEMKSSLDRLDSSLFDYCTFLNSAHAHIMKGFPFSGV